MFDRPLDSLGNDLLNSYKGRQLTVEQVFNNHQVGTPFVIQNYKEALRRLESEGRIICDPSERRKIKGVKSMADSTNIIFPR